VTPRIARRSAQTRAQAGWHTDVPMPSGVPVSFFSFELDPALAADPVFDLHRHGKMAIAATVPAGQPRRPVARLHAGRGPGSARRSRADESLAADYTWIGNTVAVVTDGSAVLGLGNIGPEGRDARHGGQGGAVQAVRRPSTRVPICLDTPGHRGTDRDRQGARAVLRRGSTSRTSARRAASRSSAGSTRRSTSRSSTDDQHGTAVVVLAALRNAVALLGPPVRRPAGG